MRYPYVANNDRGLTTLFTYFKNNSKNVSKILQDMTTGEGGLLQVCLEGVGLLFANSKVRENPFSKTY